jgi:hypothetical protein
MVLKKNKQLLSNLGGIEYKIIQGKIKDHSSNCKKKLRILSILWVYKFMLFKTRDLKRLNLTKMSLMVAQLISLGKNVW